MLFESNVLVTKIRSFDVDDSCKEIAEKFNMPWVVDNWKFKATTLDINSMQYPTTYETLTYDKKFVTLTDMPDTIINTSCEYISNFNDWSQIFQKKINL